MTGRSSTSAVSWDSRIPCMWRSLGGEGGRVRVRREGEEGGGRVRREGGEEGG